MAIFDKARNNNLLHPGIDLKKALQLRRRVFLLSPISAIPLIFANRTWLSILLYVIISIIGVIIGARVNVIEKKLTISARSKEKHERTT